MLDQSVEHVGCETRHAKGDADVLIVETTVLSAMYCETTLVGDNTDLLVLLCFHVKEDSCGVFFKPEVRSWTKKSPRCWNIKYVQRVLGRAVCNNVLFAHAVLGCDTTFSVDKHFITQADVFLQENASLAGISSAGEATLLCLYTGAVGDTLDKLRVLRFHEKVPPVHVLCSRKTFLRHHQLPSTIASVCTFRCKYGRGINAWSTSAST